MPRSMLPVGLLSIALAGACAPSPGSSAEKRPARPPVETPAAAIPPAASAPGAGEADHDALEGGLLDVCKQGAELLWIG